MKKPVIDISECVMCDICVEICPEVFKKNEAGYIEVSDDIYEKIDKMEDGEEKKRYVERLNDDINEIIKSCRGGCISWGEED